MGIVYFSLDLVLNQEVTLTTIRVISGREARLKEFERLAESDPPDAQLTIQQAASARLPVTDKQPAPPESDYTACGAPGEEHEKREQRAQIRSAHDALAAVDLNRKARPDPAKSLTPPVEPPPTSAPSVVTSLFDAGPGTWTRNIQGFYLHPRSAYINSLYFNHGFDLLRIGKRIGHENKVTNLSKRGRLGQLSRIRLDGQRADRSRSAARKNRGSAEKAAWAQCWSRTFLTHRSYGGGGRRLLSNWRGAR